jgi:hypothetical protein
VVETKRIELDTHEYQLIRGDGAKYDENGMKVT